MGYIVVILMIAAVIWLLVSAEMTYIRADKEKKKAQQKEDSESKNDSQ